MTRKQRKSLLEIIISAVTLVICILIPTKGILRAILFLIPYLIVGRRVLHRAFKNILNGRIFDEQFLMTLATLGAFALREYTEAVAVMLFYQIGELFQSIAVGKSRKSIAALMDIRPDSATVLRDGKEITVDPIEVLKGETIIIRAGEKIPLDGIVLSGNTSVNTSALTGESMPVDVFEGDRVISGSINLSSVIAVRAENIYTESTVAKILDLVENSSEKKAKTETFITRFAKYYTPCVVFAAVILAFIPPIFSGDLAEWIERALIFLVVSCPCALVISVPLSFFGGIGGASRQGILIKGAEYLELLAKAGIFVFDKTGTLTQGDFEVAEIHSEEMSESELLYFAAAAESRSTHPIALSLIKAYNKPLDLSAVGQIKEYAGMGIMAEVDSKTIFAGNEKLMELVGAIPHKFNLDGTVIHISEKNKYLGYIVISDKIKPESERAIKELYSLKISKTVMLTGDKKNIAEKVGAKLGMSEIYAELMPNDKVNAVEGFLNKNIPLAFVGDGINDAPVLARADIGIAMGAMGSDAAIEAADIVLMDDNPLKLVTAVLTARKTMGIVRMNIIFALLVKLLVMVLGAIGIANMWLAIFADVGVTVIAILNDMRAMRMKFDLINI